MIGNMRVIGIVGTRRRNSEEEFKLIERELLYILQEKDIICSGGCQTGADRFAKRLHEKYLIPYLEFPANWNKYGKKAGAIRNFLIARHSDILIAMVVPNSTALDGEYSGGTEITINAFKNGKSAEEIKERLRLL